MAKKRKGPHLISAKRLADLVERIDALRHQSEEASVEGMTADADLVTFLDQTGMCLQGYLEAGMVTCPAHVNPDIQGEGYADCP